MLVLHANKLLRNVTEFAELIFASRRGITVQLGDVASVKDSVETVRPYANLNGEASIALAILRQLGANTVRVVDSATHALVKIKEHAKVVRQRPDRYCHKRHIVVDWHCQEECHHDDRFNGNGPVTKAGALVS